MSFKVIADAAKKAAGTSVGSRAINLVKDNPIMATVGVGNFMYDVNNQTKQGNGLGVSIMKAGIETALWDLNPVLMTAATLAPMAVQGGVAAHKFRRQRAEERYDMKHNSYGQIGGNFVDTMQAQTMRQAAVQQIQGNKLNARSALGGEARIFSNKIY